MALYLDEAALRACLPEREIFAVVSATLAQLGSGQAISGPKAGFSLDRDGDHRHMGMVSGCVPDQGVAGVKWYITSESNPGRGLPHVPATLLIVDSTTGLLAGVVDATQLTAARTAAVAVAAALRAVRGEAKKAAIVGAGRVGRAVLGCLIACSAVEQIAVSARNVESAEAACRAAGADASRRVAVRSVVDAHAGVADADLVFVATSVAQETPLVHASWLKPTSVICGLGSQVEVDRSVIDTAAQILVDDPQAVQVRGNLAGAFRAARLSEEAIAGTIGALMAGQVPRPRGSGHIFIVSIGLGVLDVALGGRALENARRLGIGQQLGEQSPRERGR